MENNDKLHGIKEDLHKLVHVGSHWVKVSQEHEKELTDIIDRIVKKWTNKATEI